MDFLFQTRALNVVKSKRAGQSGPVRRPEINPSADVFPQDLGKGIGVWGSKLHGVTLNHKASDQICGPFVVCWFSWLRGKHNSSQVGPTGLRHGNRERGLRGSPTPDAGRSIPTSNGLPKRQGAVDEIRRRWSRLPLRGLVSERQRHVANMPLNFGWSSLDQKSYSCRRGRCRASRCTKSVDSRGRRWDVHLLNRTAGVTVNPVVESHLIFVHRLFLLMASTTSLADSRVLDLRRAA